MNESMQHAVVDVMELLTGLTDEGVRPDVARARLQAVRGRHPELALELLSEEEAYDGSFHYDALIRRAGEATVSLSYCPEAALPWPLRGVHRWSEADLVRVNAKLLKVDEAIALLDFIWDDARIIDRLLNACLIREELERSPIVLSDAELQQAMDDFRIAKKLFSASDTHAWLEGHGMTHERLERYVHDLALGARLRDRVAAERVEDHFRNHAKDFDSVSFARIEVAEEGQAQALAEQIRDAGLDFFAAAERSYAQAAERGTPRPAALFGTVSRRDAAPSMREALFAAPPGKVLGPFARDGRFELWRVVAISPARLDARTRNAIKDILFDAWLAERRRNARIEWYWGNVRKTG